jgi:hypothetical protein
VLVSAEPTTLRPRLRRHFGNHQSLPPPTVSSASVSCHPPVSGASLSQQLSGNAVVLPGRPESGFGARRV